MENKISNNINKDFKDLTQKVSHLKDFKCLKGSSTFVNNFSAPKFAEKNDLCIAYSKKDISVLESKDIAILVVDHKLKNCNFKNFKHVYTCSELQAFQEKIITHFCIPRDKRKEYVNLYPHSCFIDPTAKIGKGSMIEPNVVIGKNVIIGKNTIVRANTIIEFDVQIGNDCDIQSQVFIGHSCIIKDHVIIDSGAKIGTSGFGFYQSKNKSHIHIPHVGNVVIEKHCYIGANTCIDRAKLHTTHINEGCKIDNLCQIAHNVIIGKHSILCGFTGIGGSCELGNHVICGGNVGIIDNIQIVDDVILAARTGVRQSITKKGTYAGDPCVEIKTFLKQSTILKKLTLNKNVLFSK